MMKIVRASQRIAARKAPARERRAFVNPSTSFTDEYINADDEPRLPFSHAASGRSNSNSKNQG
jgi:hypothetical protein